jgi:hypothetical protein
MLARKELHMAALLLLKKQHMTLTWHKAQLIFVVSAVMSFWLTVQSMEGVG